MRQARDPGAYVLLFFLCFFVLLSSGRIASSDAGVFPDLLLARVSTYSRTGFLITVLVLVGGVATAWRCVSVILGPTAVERTAAVPPAGQYR